MNLINKESSNLLEFWKLLSSFLLSFSFLIIGGCDDEVEPFRVPGSISVEDQDIENFVVKIDTLSLDKAGWLLFYREKEDGSGPLFTGPSTEPLYLESGNFSDLKVSVQDLGDLNDGDRLWAVLHSDNGQIEVYENKEDSSLDTPLLNENGELVASAFSVKVIAFGLIRANTQLISQDSVQIKRIIIRNKDGWVVARKANSNEPGPEGIISHPLFVSEGEHKDLFIRLLGDSDLADGEEVQLVLHEDTGTAGEFEYNGQGELDEPVKDLYSSGDPLQESNPVQEFINVYRPYIVAERQLINENIIVIDEVLAATDGWLAVFLEQAGSTSEGPIGVTKIDSGRNEDLNIDLSGAILTKGEKVLTSLYVDGVDPSAFINEDSQREFFDARPIEIEVQTIPPSGFVEARDVAVSDNIIMTDNINGDIDGWFTLCRSNADNSGPDPNRIISQAGNLFSADNPHVGLVLTEAVEVGETVYVLVHVDNGQIDVFEFEDNLGYDEVVASKAIKVLPNTASITVSDQILQGNTLVIDDIEMNTNSWLVVHPEDGAGDPDYSVKLSSPIKIAAGGLYEGFEVQLNSAVLPGAILNAVVYNDNGIINKFEFDGENELDKPLAINELKILDPQGSIQVQDQEVSGNTLIVESIMADQPSIIAIFKDDGTKTGPDKTKIISEPFPIEAGDSKDLILTINDSIADYDRLWVGLHNDNGQVGKFEFYQSDILDRMVVSAGLDIRRFQPTNYIVSRNNLEDLIFNGGDYNNSINPTLELIRGKTYTFTIEAKGSSFYITRFQTTGSFSAYDKRISNNGARSGIIIFTIPMDAPDKLYYNAGIDLGGEINIID